MGLIFKVDGYADVTDDNDDGNVFAAAGACAVCLLHNRWRDWYWELVGCRLPFGCLVLLMMLCVNVYGNGVGSVLYFLLLDFLQ